MTLNTEIPDKLELRAMLENMVRRDLLGPAGGEDEQLHERTVRGRYIVGLLAPSNHAPLEEDVITSMEGLGELAVDGGASTEDGKTPHAVPDIGGTSSFLPSSMGLTFSLESGVHEIQVRVKWGRYHRIIDKEAETSVRYWQREPMEAIVHIPLSDGQDRDNPFEDAPEVYLTWIMRQYDDGWTVTLFLVNGQAEPKKLKDEAWVFQPEIEVTADGGAAVFIKRQVDPSLMTTNVEDRAMQMLYRETLEFAVGHGVSVGTELSDRTVDHASAVWTETIPQYEVNPMEPPTSDDIPLLGDLVTDMKVLSKTQMGDFSALLNPLTDAYEQWIGERWGEVNNPTPELEIYVSELDAQRALENCEDALRRIREGIDLLDNDELAAEAFRFANQAMWLQRIRSIFSREVRRDTPVDEADIDIPRNRSWRPFQLAFVLLNLPGLTDPTHPDRGANSESDKGIADLLWFPTGGGKTEAYLGVAAFTMGIRRLQGELGGLINQAGVTVLMRYTLRLLTLQQFQRATTLISACELIRRDDPEKWGIEPFRIGLWVGQSSTPNWTKQSHEIVKQDHGQWMGGAFGRGTPAQLTNCPWCGSEIKPGRDIIVEPYGSGRGRTFQYCSDTHGNCPFSRKMSPDEGIPILVVDEEIYRRLPALLIATVDKFAQMPWKGATQMLFGRVDGYCPRHGYRSSEIEDTDSHRKNKKHPACSTQPIDGGIRPPDLIIQDELHLISGPLGTLVGLYETAVDELCSWELDGQTVRPKVIASTATIRRASQQVHNLFLRDLNIFPPPALNADDNFFAKEHASTNKSPGRLYIGISAPGTRLKTVLIRVYVAFMAAAQKLYDQYGKLADPYMTLVGYFNSMRELGGMRRVMDDAVKTRLSHMEERGLANRQIFPWTVDELTSRKGATEIPKLLDRLESPHIPYDPDNSNSKRTFDAALATNMISVGVDVPRLGLMVVAGQPKATAEYIQATSRVGRSHPGIVCTVYNWSRPRDISHYERFNHYHATFYQQVEALSVTPFSSRAIDRGLSGALVSLIRLWSEEFNANGQANELSRSHALVEEAIRLISIRAGKVTQDTDVEERIQQHLRARIDEWISRAENPHSSLGYQTKRDSDTIGLLEQPNRGGWSQFTCLNSLRDVEPSVDLILLDHHMD